MAYRQASTFVDATNARSRTASAQADARPQVTQPRNSIPWAGAAWLLAALALTATSAAPARAQSGAYARELAAARRAGLPTRPADLQRPLPPEGRNAAPLWRKLDALLKAHRLTSNDDTDLTALLGRTPPTAAQVARGRQLLANRRDVLTVIHQAAERPACVFERKWSLGPAVLFPEYARMRMASRWLMGESGLLLYDGKLVEAARNMAFGYRIAQQAASDPTIIAELVAVAIDSITDRGLENILYRAGDRPGVADAVRQAVEREWRPHSLAHALGGEMVIAGVSLELIRRGNMKALNAMLSNSSLTNTGPPARPGSAERRQLDAYVDASGAMLVRSVRRLIAAADKPYPSASAAFRRAAHDIQVSRAPGHELLAVLLPVYTALPARRASDEARAAVVRCAAALLAYRRAHGGFPPTLAAAIAPVPADPFDLKALRYRRDGAGFTVWSVGETLKFDGRAADTKQYAREAVFQYPAPAFLK